MGLTFWPVAGSVREIFEDIYDEVKTCWGVFDDPSTRSHAIEVTAFPSCVVNVCHLGTVMSALRHWCVRMSLAITVIFMPVYFSLTVHYGTYTHKYSWQASIAYLSGMLPAVSCLLLFAGLLFVVFSKSCSRSKLNYHYVVTCINTMADRQAASFPNSPENTYRRDSLGLGRGDETPFASRNSSAKSNYTTSTRKEYEEKDFKEKAIWYTKLALCIALNFFVVILVNMAYVYVLSLSVVDVSIKRSMAIGLSSFKLIWNLAITNLIDLVEDTPAVDYLHPHHVPFSGMFLTWLFFINNLVVPCVAIALLNPDCLYYAFFPPPNVHSEYTYAAYGSGDESTVRSTFAPPFDYSYQCSSALLVAFSEVFIYRFMLGGILWPVTVLLFKYLQEQIYISYGEHTRWFVFFTFWLPPLCRPLRSLNCREHSHRVECGIICAFSDWGCPTWNEVVLFPPEERIASVTTDLAIILAFGTIMPPIAIVGCISICMSTAFDQFCVGHFLVMAQEHPYLHCRLPRLNKDCQKFGALFKSILGSLCWLLPVIWGFYLYDVSGLVGGRSAFPVLSAIVALGLLINLSNKIKRAFCKRHRTVPVDFNSIAEEDEDCSLGSINGLERLEAGDLDLDCRSPILEMERLKPRGTVDTFPDIEEFEEPEREMSRFYG